MGTERPNQMFRTSVRNLCTKYIFHITFKPGLCPLNKKSEMFNNCTHKMRVLLGGTEDQDLDLNQD